MDDTSPKYAVLYSPDLSDRICDLFIEGLSISKIARLDGMPAEGTLWRWMKENDAFRIKMQAAREIRAMQFEERAIDEALSADGKEDVHARLRFDALKWGAEVNDPGKYGKKTTISGDATRPLKFIISTGFPDLTDAQKPPKIGADGLIEKKVIEVAAKEIAIDEDES